MSKKKLHVKLITVTFKESSGMGLIEYGVRLLKALKQFDKDLVVSTRTIVAEKLFTSVNKKLLRDYDEYPTTNNKRKKSQRPDILHYLEPATMAIDSSLLIKPKNTRVVATIHDLDSIRRVKKVGFFRYTKNKNPMIGLTNAFLNSIITFVSQTGIKRAMRNSDHIVCVSEKTREEVIRYLKVSPSKCSVVYPIIAPEFKRMKKNKDKNKIVIGHISSYLYNKNAETLIKAFQNTKNPKLELRLYGGKLPFNIGNDSRIKYFGHVPNKELPRVFNSFDVFVFPSYWEGFGMPIMEAKRCKVPVITYAKGQLPDAVKSNTIQFKNERHLTEILEKRGWEKADVNKAYLDTKKTEPRYVAKKMDEVYRKLLK